MPDLDEASAVNTLPIKEKRERKKKERKYRRYIYLTEKSIEKVDALAAEITGGNFSMMIQILVSEGLKKHEPEK